MFSIFIFSIFLAFAFKAVSLVFLAWHLARYGLQQDMSQRWKVPLQHCGRVGRCIQWPLGFQGFPLIRDAEGLLDDIRCKGLNRNNRHQQISIEDFNETLSDHLANSVIIFCSVWGKVTHFVSWCWAYSLNDVVSAIERWVQKSNEDARNVFLWMCFFCNNQYRIKEEAPKSSRGSCYDMWQLLSQFTSVFACDLWPRFYRWARNSGWITQVMCGGCIIKTSRPSFLIVELYVSWHSFHRRVDGQFCPWRRLKQEATIWKKSSNPIWWKRDICWCCSIPLCQGLIMAYLSYLMKVRKMR